MWNQRYDVEAYVYGREPNEFLVDRADLLPAGGKVLSLAEGEGRNAVFLAGRGHEVVAVDASSVGLAKARRLAVAAGVRITTIEADLADFAIEPDGYAGVVSIFCHMPPVVRRALHRRVVTGLQPGGALLLEAYTPAQLALGTGGPRDPDLLMTLADLANELAGLDLVEARELERDVHEGVLHTGRGSVVQVVGRKPRPPLP